jgi:hypothetical protein
MGEWSEAFIGIDVANRLLGIMEQAAWILLHQRR